MGIILFLVLAAQFLLGAGYPEGRPDCPVPGQWVDLAANRTVSVKAVQPGFLDYLKFQSLPKYEMEYKNNWDIHKGEVKSGHGNFLLAGVVPSVQKKEDLLYLVLACYRRELWVMAIPYLSGDFHSSAFFKLSPLVSRASDDLDDIPPQQPANGTNNKILVNVSMWGGGPEALDDRHARKH